MPWLAPAIVLSSPRERKPLCAKPATDHPWLEVGARGWRRTGRGTGDEGVCGGRVGRPYVGGPEAEVAACGTDAKLKIRTPNPRTEPAKRHFPLRLPFLATGVFEELQGPRTDLPERANRDVGRVVEGSMNGLADKAGSHPEGLATNKDEDRIR